MSKRGKYVKRPVINSIEVRHGLAKVILERIETYTSLNLNLNRTRPWSDKFKNKAKIKANNIEQRVSVY
jgi:hypothetical protein